MHEPQPAPEVELRPARPDEAAALSALALRSKAVWGYDRAFIEACRATLTVTPADIVRHTITVAVAQQTIVGFYELADQPPDGELQNLFIAPEWIGRGVGRQLWQHAVQTARAQGFRQIELDSDPFAEPFYRAMGAQRVGERESTVVAGRMLPLMRYML